MIEIMKGEFFGTMLLILLGCGVVANVVLSKTKGNNAGWIVITFGWATALFIGVNTSTHLGGSGHLNPAVTLAFMLFKDFDAAIGFHYILAQFLGAMTGAALVWITYQKQFEATENKEAVLGVFSTSPAVRSTTSNLLTEMIGTFVLVFGALCFSPSLDTLGTLNALPAALLLLAIGLSLGGPTGYAINPARDLGPRIMHGLLPIRTKGSSDWNYAWIPVVGPIIGACLAVLLYNVVLP